MKYAVLIVEDEPDIAQLINNRLDGSVYDVQIMADGLTAIGAVVKNSYDLVVLDIMLPKIDGYEICRMLRQKNKETIIMVVSSLDTEEHRLKAYSMGADDFMAKPFSARELAAKIDTLLKRRYEIQNGSITLLKSIKHDIGAKKIFIDGNHIALTPSEYLIFVTLLKTPKIIISREDLAQIIFDSGFGSIDARGIDTHIYNIRKKISAFSAKQFVLSERGVGYKINEL